jgi:hypothetical protein
MTRKFCIIFRDANGAWHVVLNSRCRTLSAAQTLLADRRANGDAFPAEQVWPDDCTLVERDGERVTLENAGDGYEASFCTYINGSDAGLFTGWEGEE